jgi:hypothetical protein
MHSPGVLAPMVALVAWSLVMWVWLYATRLPAMARLRVPPAAGRFARGLNERLPDGARQAADNYNHLMEQPTLFYAIGFALLWLGQGAHPLNVAFAWGYVGLRVVHSVVQATANHVPTRFTVFVLSTLCLAALTLHAAVGVLRQG